MHGTALLELGNPKIPAGDTKSGAMPPVLLGSGGYVVCSPIVRTNVGQCYKVADRWPVAVFGQTVQLAAKPHTTLQPFYPSTGNIFFAEVDL